jgi:hypothetical protein
LDKTKEPINKGCDLVLVLPEAQKRILILDLKSDRPNLEKTRKQLLNSELYVRYLLTIIYEHYRVDTNTIDFKRAFVTTDPRDVPKSYSYHPKEEQDKASEKFNKVPVTPKGDEAFVHLGKLLREV